MNVRQVVDLPSGEVSTVHVPIIGAALCAGFSSPVDDFLEGALELPRWLVPNPPASFLLTIRGESMRGAGIFDRDLALADRSMTPSHDSVVVAVVDRLLSCKRFVIDGNVPRLAFDNPDLPAFAVDEICDVEVWGVVRFTIRWHVERAALRR